MLKTVVITCRIFAALSFGLFCTSNASAYTYWSGKISEIFFSGTGNFAFRVIPASSTPFNTTCLGNFAYMDTGDSNYQVYASALMTAFAGGKTIQLTLLPDAQGYCHLIEGGVYAQ